jgi:predicted nucleotidyltransferase
VKNIQEMLSEQKQVIEKEYGYKVAYICLYGSQNYGLDIQNEQYQSDFDMKAIIVPTLDELIKNSKPVSTVIDTEYGQCDIKDIRSYMETLLKANPAYVETLYTDYFIIDNDFYLDFSKIREKRDELAKALRTQLIRAMYGMMCEKEKALCHPYPSIAHKIEEFGYCGKQLSHAERLWLMMRDYYGLGISLKHAFIPVGVDKDYLIDLKLNKPSLEEAKEIMKNCTEKAKAFKDKILSRIDESKIDYSVKEEYIMLSQAIIRDRIISQFIPRAG